jgi:hypothetical protein
MHIRQALIKKGVIIPNPEGVEIGSDIKPERIASGVTIHSGCKLFGSDTHISEGAIIGLEGPATIANCFIGPRVSLKGGYFQEATFLEKSSCGLGAHVRAGTILEEQASIAHTVGLKQTILFPFVTLGSLINFCDCLMAGGTSRDNHSEVGSSYIHFNYTPNQDKATPSLMGDVPRGVMLNQSPIFLGGQGGLVGPCQLAYGTVVAAGTICRKDQVKEDYLVIESPPRTAQIPFQSGGYGNLKRILNHNLVYLGQLFALNQWYVEVRSRFVSPQFHQELLDGLIITLGKCIQERIKQLGKLGSKILKAGKKSVARPEVAFFRDWRKVERQLLSFFDFQGVPGDKDSFLAEIDAGIALEGREYLRVIRNLEAGSAGCGTRWMQSIVDHVVQTMMPGKGA